MKEADIYRAVIPTMMESQVSTECYPMVAKQQECQQSYNMKSVAFTKMEDGTIEDYSFLAKHEKEFILDLPNRIISSLEKLKDSFSGYKIDRLEHSLQTATRALRDKADIDWVVSALIHDIGDDLAPLNHDTLAASVVAPYVREECTWVIKHHGIFQLKYYGDKIGLNPEERQKFKNHPYYKSAVKFCEKWDQKSFDPNYDTLPLDYFKPMIIEVFSREAWVTN